MSAIDYFKYKALLSELENKKDTKLKISRFISKVFELSDSLSTLRTDRESTRYAFILITKAISYNQSANKCKKAIFNQVESIARYLLNFDILTEDNILETYEFWDQTLNFSPTHLADLLRIESLMSILEGKHTYSISCYNIREVYPLELSSVPFVKLFMLSTVGPDSLIIRALGTTTMDIAHIISVVEPHLQNIQLILKEAHEQHSRSSDAV